MSNENNVNNQKTSEKQSKGISKGLIIAIVVIIVVLYFGQKFLIRRAGEKMVEKAIEVNTGSKVDIGNEGIKIRDEKGTMEVGTSAQWPKDMPSDVPQFKFGIITAAIKTTQELKGWSVLVKDVTKENADAYTKELADKGWTLKSQITMMADIQQFEKNGYSLNFAYDPSSSGVNLTIQEIQK